MNKQKRKTKINNSWKNKYNNYKINNSYLIKIWTKQRYNYKNNNKNK